MWVSSPPLDTKKVQVRPLIWGLTGAKGTAGYNTESEAGTMSSYEARRNPRNGEVSHRIRFRHAGQNLARTFHTEAKARAWQALVDDPHIGPGKALLLLDDVKPETTASVADQIDHHIAHLTNVTDGTRKRYQRIADTKLRPRFERILLADVSRDDVALWMNEALAAGAKAKTVRNWQGLLSSALASAVRDGKMPANPARSVRPPRQAESEMVFLTREEFARLHDLLPEQHRPLALLLALTGIRWGEATALTVRDLDRASHSARIHQAWKHTNSGAMILGPPKSKRSNRTVAVPDEVFTSLEPALAGKAGRELLFTAPRGGPLRSGTFHNSVWQRVATHLEHETGKKPRIHDLRHTFASWALTAGVPLPVIQRQMGHESITTTVDTYGHLARSDFDPLLSLGGGIRTDTHAIEA